MLNDRIRCLGKFPARHKLEILHHLIPDLLMSKGKIDDRLNISEAVAGIVAFFR